uniref:Uncharacterized protein n=1 Tax=Solanum tuberosum TaxID=4113 RepID=M0ZKF6_SOLTU
MCCEGPFGAISRDRRSIRRSALWSISSPFCFGLQHLQVLYFGRYGTASQNRSVIRRLLISIADLIFSFRARHTETLGEIMVIRRLAQWISRPKMCCEGPFGTVSRDRRSIRRSTLWSISSPFCFGLQHHQVLYFGRYGTPSRNRSVTRRLLISIVDLIFSFRARHTETLGKTMAIWRLAQWIRRSSGFLFFVFSAALFLFA